MKTIVPILLMVLLCLYLVYNANGAYEQGFADGVEVERPIEIKIREYNCIPMSELPTAYPYMGMNGTYVTFVENARGEEVPVKVCDE